MTGPCVRCTCTRAQPIFSYITSISRPFALPVFAGNFALATSTAYSVPPAHTVVAIVSWTPRQDVLLAGAIEMGQLDVRGADGDVFMTVSSTADDSVEYTDPLDDVFGSSPTSPGLPSAASDVSQHVEQRPRPSDPSDIPRLRSIHVTNGYREGIAASKDKFIQEGFDEGYALGAEIGALAGWCLGALEGISRARPRRNHTEPVGTANVAENTMTKDLVDDMRVEAEKELAIHSLLGKDFFGADGIWLYDVHGEEQEGEIAFREVAKAHPLLQKWTRMIEDITRDMRPDLTDE